MSSCMKLCWYFFLALLLEIAKKSRSARFMELDTSHYLVAYQYVWYPSRFLICAEPPGFLTGIHNCAVPFFLAFYSK